MSKAYPDIFADWLLNELRDAKNFTLLADNDTLKHLKHNIEIRSCSGAYLYIVLNNVRLSEIIPSVMLKNMIDLYFQVRKIYLDSYEASDKIRREKAVNDFVFHNLMNY